MIAYTFYAAVTLTGGPHEKQDGFDWLWAAGEMARTLRQTMGIETRLVTDTVTDIDCDALRVGNASASGLMLWLLEAQAAAIESGSGAALLVSPDTLFSAPVDMMFGDWDVCVLTRRRPTPIINSVIAVRRSRVVASLWCSMREHAETLPEESKNWGADVDAIVDVLGIRPQESGIREHGGAYVKLLPVDGVFRSVNRDLEPRRMMEPVWDFKGFRKKLMPSYARLL